MFMSTLAFFLANVFVKQVTHIPAMEIVFFRCVVACGLCVIGLRRANASLVGSNHLMLLLRGVFGTTALFLFFLDSAADAARIGTDDPISFPDIYGDVRHFYPRRGRKDPAMVFSMP
jgi:hypothetical protein